MGTFLKSFDPALKLRLTAQLGPPIFGASEKSPIWKPVYPKTASLCLSEVTMLLTTFSKNINAKIAGLAVLALTALLSVQVHAQVAGGTLSGIVTDQSGAVVPKAEISIKNIATGVTRAVLSDPAGFYSAPNLLPGSYEITTAAPGFSSAVRTGITVTVGAQQVLNLTLQVGQVTEKVQVTGEAPTVQLATSSISAVVDSTTVRELPLNGRSWTDLANLQ